MARAWQQYRSSDGQWVTWPADELPYSDNIFNAQFLNQFIYWERYIYSFMYDNWEGQCPEPLEDGDNIQGQITFWNELLKFCARTVEHWVVIKDELKIEGETVEDWAEEIGSTAVFSQTHIDTPAYAKGDAYQLTIREYLRKLRNRIDLYEAYYGSIADAELKSSSNVIHTWINDNGVESETSSAGAATNEPSWNRSVEGTYLSARAEWGVDYVLTRPRADAICDAAIIFQSQSNAWSGAFPHGLPEVNGPDAYVWMVVADVPGTGVTIIDDFIETTSSFIVSSPQGGQQFYCELYKVYLMKDTVPECYK